MLNTNPPNPLHQSILQHLQQQNIYIINAYIDNEQSNSWENFENNYRNQVKAVAELYQKDLVRGDFELVCVYVGGKDGGISVKYGTARGMKQDRNTKIIECRILGLMTKHTNLHHFIQVYSQKQAVVLSEKSGPIHKNNTMQNQKKWAIIKFGKPPSRKSSSVSSSEEKISKPISPKKGERKKLQLVSGSEESSEVVYQKQGKQANTTVKPSNKDSKQQTKDSRSPELKFKNFKSKNRRNIENKFEETSQKLISIVEADRNEEISNKKNLKRQLEEKIQHDPRAVEDQPHERTNHTVLRKIMKKPIELQSHSFNHSQNSEEQQQKLLAELSLSQSSQNLSKQKPINPKPKRLNFSSQPTKTSQPLPKQKKSRKKNAPPPNNTTLDQFFLKKK